MRPFLPFATLLGAAFLLGCQEQGSEPVGPDGPQFDKPGTITDEAECAAVGGILDAKGHCHAGDKGGNEEDLIEVGRKLFFEETFDGNGRTCGTCHRVGSNMTIDVDFITTLHDEDPFDLLFIAERTPAEQTVLGVNLPAFDPDDPLVPAFEAPDLMRDRGLILENILGFDVDETADPDTLFFPPVFRAPPSLFNLSKTAPYGLSGEFADLRVFAVGAVMQHFPKTLNRKVDVDFRLPTESELDALEAFMLSLESPADGNFKVSGPRSILSTDTDPRAKDTSRPEVSGRDLFFSVGCTSCHGRNKLFSGGNRATGVEDLPININDDLPRDIGAGTVTDPSFQTPGLFGLRKTAFFHNNAVGNTGVQVDNLRASVAFYVSTAFKNSPTGLQVAGMSGQDIDDITAFLVAISKE